MNEEMPVRLALKDLEVNLVLLVRMVSMVQMVKLAQREEKANRESKTLVSRVNQARRILVVKALKHTKNASTEQQQSLV